MLSKCSDNLAGDDASMLKFLRLRDRVLRRPEQAQERLDNSLEVIRIARQQSDWVALFEGEWARKVSSFQLGSAGAKTGLELLEHAARLAGPNTAALSPHLGEFRQSSMAGSPKAKSCSRLAAR